MSLEKVIFAKGKMEKEKPVPPTILKKNSSRSLSTDQKKVVSESYANLNVFIIHHRLDFFFFLRITKLMFFSK